MATWLREELPEEWPVNGTQNTVSAFASSAKENKASPEDVSFQGERTQPSVLDHLDGTVAYNRGNHHIPQWKQNLHAKRSHHGGIDELIGIFGDRSESTVSSFGEQPDGTTKHKTSAAANRAPGGSASGTVIAGPQRRSGFSDENSLSTDSSGGSSGIVPEYPHSRRLKVFGQADTFTNERLDGFLTSLQGHKLGETLNSRVQTSQEDVSQQLPSLPSPAVKAHAGKMSKVSIHESTPENSRKVLDSMSSFGAQKPSLSHHDERDGVVNTFANRSDVAARYLNNGQDVLSRIRKASMLNLQRQENGARAGANATTGRRDESLDDLERRLNGATIDTTASESSDKRVESNGSNGSTLSVIESWDNSDSSTVAAPHDGSQNEKTKSAGPAGALFSQPPPLQVREPLRNQRLASSALSSGLSSAYTGSLDQRGHPAEVAPNSRYSSSSSVVYRPNMGSGRSAVQFASPNLPDVSTLAIAGGRTPEEDDPVFEEHNLESKPSIAQVDAATDNSGSSSANVVVTTSDSGNSYESVKLEPPRKQSTPTQAQFPSVLKTQSGRRPRSAVSFGVLPQQDQSDSLQQHSLQATPPTPKRAFFPTQDHLPAQAFEASFRDSSLYERPMPTLMSLPGNATTDSYGISQRDITFSHGMLEIAKALDGRDTSKTEVADLSRKGLDAIKGLDLILPAVRDLDLSYNEIKTVEGMPNSLVTLNLAANTLDRLTVFPSCNIVSLDLSNNYLSDLRGLARLQSLTQLNVSNNSLRSLHGIESLTVLQTLNVEHNSLDSVTIKSLQLKELHASFNPIKAMRLDTPNLETLIVRNAEIVTLGPLPSVKQLDVSFNQACIDFKGWDSLDNLVYDGNREARNFGSIQPRTLSWQANDVIGFDERSLLYCCSATLSGSGFNLEKLKGVYPLVELDMSGMDLQTLHERFPHQFPALRILSLSFNNLDERALVVLSRFRTLEQLSLFGNRIKDAAEVVHYLKHCRRLTMLDLRLNPVTKDLYQEILIDRNQPPSQVYEEVLGLDWENADDNWKANQHSLQRARQLYTRRLLELPRLNWLDGLDIQRAKGSRNISYGSEQFSSMLSQDLDTLPSFKGRINEVGETEKVVKVPVGVATNVEQRQPPVISSGMVSTGAASTGATSSAVSHGQVVILKEHREIARALLNLYRREQSALVGE